MHQLKFGVQLPNLGRRVLEDFTNRQGTYTFASLAAYGQNTPVTYTLQQGQTRFLTHYDQPGAFFLDQIQVTPRLTVTPASATTFKTPSPARWTPSSPNSPCLSGRQAARARHPHRRRHLHAARRRKRRPAAGALSVRGGTQPAAHFQSLLSRHHRV